MKVLIIGCGYVGLALGTELVRRGHQVTGLCRTGSREPELIGAGLTMAIADVTKPESLRGLAPDYDWVVNCVSATGGGLEGYKEVYLEGTRHVLQWLSASPLRNYVYTSSTSVYGQIDGGWIDETSPTAPVSATSQVLVQTERELLEAASNGFRATILRVAGIYGPGRAYWLEQVRAGTACLDGAGERILNMIHRDDVVGAICAALERARPGQVYNVVDNEPVSQRTFLEWLSTRLNAPVPQSSDTAFGTIKKRGLTNKCVSNRKFREELAFQLEFPTFREGYTRLFQTAGSTNL